MAGKRKTDNNQVQLDLWSEELRPSEAKERKTRKRPAPAPQPEQTLFPTESAELQSVLSRKNMLRGVLAFLAEQNPTGMALQVALNRVRPSVGAAAFWRDGHRNSTLSRCVIVEIGESREQCFAKCAGHEERLAKLRELRLEKLRMEHRIREEEPELRSSDELFDDFQRWDFSRSRNREYRKLLRDMEILQHAIYRGSRLERIRRTAAADYLYLAVPDQMLSVEELPIGWGLLYIAPDRKHRIVKVPDRQNCEASKRFALACNIAEKMTSSVLFRHGLHLDDNGKTVFTRIPRKRTKELLEQ